MEKKIMIGIPVNRWLSSQFAISLQRITHWLIQNQWTVDLNYDNGSVLAMQRNKIMATAHKAEMDLLFVDSDMVFDESAVEAVISTPGDLVGGLCFMRRLPFPPAVFAEDRVDEECVFTGVRFKDIPIYPFEVAAVGCAFLYIPYATIDRVMSEYRFPFNNYEMSNGEQLGEDLSFFHRCGKLDLTTICVPSVEIGHITERILTRADHQATLKLNSDKECDKIEE